MISTPPAPDRTIPGRLAQRVAAVLLTVVIGATLIAAEPAAAASVVADRAAADTASTAPAASWSVAPADGDGADGRVSLRHSVAPGAIARDALAVTNTGTAETEFVVSAGDGVVGPDGAFDIVAGPSVDAGTWITVDGTDGGRILLGPGETRVLPVAIGVPAAAAPGDHPAGIVVGRAAASDGVSVTHRIGVRVHLQVQGELRARAALSDVSATYTPSWIPFAPGTLEVAYDIANTGNQRFAAAAGLRTEGPLGLSPVRAATGEPAELLPGATLRGTTAAQVWPWAVLFGEVTVTPVAVGEDAAVQAEPVTARFVHPAVSSTGLAVVLLLGVGIAAIVARSRRRRRRGPEPAPGP